MMNRWHIRKDRDPDELAPWYLYRDNYDKIDPDTDVACIEGATFITLEAALAALNEALRLDQYTIEETP